ncbi:hypothetical protein BGW36DRAFT_375384 [Talaromyces proteolyticus]|uniref:GPI anchored protein n=1 Tax=Talaromyces proteolyticus TaxID=1131652 RepID=A0AAD4KZK3_9EURO|nr:uncharacterized protein BGW36DRAFT_375384 [Talaromyces proteolyticus]KAH8701006.1 hypothetical protein BGW36DRAFT_375384 [Talaromyces proteolyticus]
MASIALATLALLGSAAAADQTVTLFLPGFDPQALVASIAGSDASATTYAIQCAPGTSSDDCGAGDGFTLIEGPKTAHLEMVDGDASTFGYINNCILTDSPPAICTEVVTGHEANDPGTTTVTYEPSDYSSALIVVTVTAGSAAAASTAASVTAPTASATGTTASAAAGSTASAGQSTSTAAGTPTSTAASTPSAAASAATTKASSVSTGGMPRVTGNVEWIVGGAAVAMALVGM